MFPKIKELLYDKNILILGFGKEGKSTLKFIKKHICYKSLTVADRNVVEENDLTSVNVIFGEHYMSSLDSYDVIIKSPGIVYNDVSSSIINKTTSQTDLFLREFRDNTVGITGTKGKSTTTTLIHHILDASQNNSVLLGNIGIPPLDVAEQMTDGKIAVFEMSCHQLEYENISPKISVIINLFEDHLDHYGTREKYVNAKENIFLHQREEDTLVISSECTEQIKKAPSKKIITVGTDDGSDYCVKNGCINEKINLPEKISLIGEHNFFNIAVAYAVGKIFNVSDEDFLCALKTYKSLPHRLEYVGTKYGVEYYDDSISTIPQTTIQAIKSLKNVGSVIIGGMDRGIDYTELTDFLKTHSVKNVILIPNTGKRIGEMLRQNNVDFVVAEDLPDAVLKAKELSLPGEKCVLSPAAASYGFYKNFEERGDVFKKLVESL